MVYRVIGAMSGSSMDGLDLAYCVLSDVGGEWSCEIEAAESLPFSDDWKQKLATVTDCAAKELIQTHVDFGHYLGQQIQLFINKYSLEHKVHFVASHGHTVFHEPAQRMTFQMGDGASMAAELELPVISDLRNMDIAFGGQGAPIVPIAEKMLWNGYEYFLNLGGIANIAFHSEEGIRAYDVCPANRVLNALIQTTGVEYDAGGQLAASGTCNAELLEKLNTLLYYQQAAPKSLSNNFGLEVVLPMLQESNLSLADQLNTMVEHIAYQLGENVTAAGKILVTGGGAHNDYLMSRISFYLNEKKIEVERPDVQTIDFKEAICMALIGALRWREEENVLAAVTGAKQNSIGGALWMGRN